MQLTDGYFSGTTLSISDSVVAVVRATNNGNQSHTITLVTEGSSHYSYVVSTIPTQQGLTCETLSGCSIIQTIQTNITNKFDKSGGTVTGGTVFQSGLTANTISATTYQNLPFSGTVVGTGTTNYVPVWTGSTGIGNSQLQDNGSQVFTNQGYGSPLTGNLSINASGTTGIAGRATQYGVYGTISGATAGASAVYGEAGNGQYGLYGYNLGDSAGEYIGVFGAAQQADSGVAGTVYIGGKFYGDNGTGGGYSVQLQDGTEGVGKVLVSQTSDGKANWNTFSGINITITSAATNTLVFSAGTGGGGGVTQILAGTNITISPTGGTGVVTINSTASGGTGSVNLGTVYTTANNFNFL